MSVGSSAIGLVLRRLAAALPLLFGVTLIGYTLTEQLGPDPVWELAGRSPTPAEMEALNAQLGRQGLSGYLDFIGGLLRLDPGTSLISGEPLRSQLQRTVPVTLALMLPGLLIGTALALWLGLVAARRHGRWLDHCIASVSALSMSISLVVVVMLSQLIFSVWLAWFPARGWSTETLADWLLHVSVPTLIIVLVNLGFNVRFFRGLWLEGLQQPSIRSARAFGLSERAIFFRRLLPWAAGPILTRLVFSVPMLLLGGSLVIETHFGIPGIGRVFYNAVLSGDQPVILAFVVLAGALVIACQALVDLIVGMLDPRLRRQ
jgi:peptide/nickel transport system permease protein